MKISLYEVPLPTSRTLRIIGSLQAAGHEVAAVHQPRYVGRIASANLGSIPVNFGGANPLRVRVQRRAEAEDSALWPAVLELPVPPLEQRPGDIDVLVHQWLTVAEALAAADHDALWAADLDALPPVVWAARARPGTPVIFDAHELFPHLDYLDPLQRPEWDAIARTFVPHVDLLLTVGQQMADHWRDDYGARTVAVVPNLAPEPAPVTTNLRDTLGLAPGVPLAVHIGNVVPNRRPELAIPLLEKFAELHVAFVGEQRYGQGELLTSMAAAAGVSDRLHLVPPVPVAQLEGFVAAADVSLILYSPATSLHLAVTMPNKLYDSLAAGVPVVATAGTAPGQFVVAENLGASFLDGDPDSLAAAVRGVIGDGALRSRVGSRRSAARWPSGEAHLLAALAPIVTAAGERRAQSPGSLGTLRSTAPAARAPASAATRRQPWSWRRVRRGVGRRIERVGRYLRR